MDQAQYINERIGECERAIAVLIKRRDALAAIRDQPVSVLGLSARSENSLRCGSIATIAELCSKTEADLLRLKNMGRGSLGEVIGALNGLQIGLCDRRCPVCHL